MANLVLQEAPGRYINYDKLRALLVSLFGAEIDFELEQVGKDRNYIKEF
jgi:hypothetical protein